MYSAAAPVVSTAPFFPPVEVMPMELGSKRQRIVRKCWPLLWSCGMHVSVRVRVPIILVPCRVRGTVCLPSDGLALPLGLSLPLLGESLVWLVVIIGPHWTIFFCGLLLFRSLQAVSILLLRLVRAGAVAPILLCLTVVVCVPTVVLALIARLRPSRVPVGGRLLGL